ncbi:MAG TPA: penicillin-insensitive murein endopeptidase [Polyangiaceae bacterium LLY-WYZ-15_(1-7)]|nr:penicillin-insensitive murein endopeptidase [Polyangiaceae bacterium LLY-WYZ-15_(1-7)]HJL10015.1 penicillin-insensitive murein endopeptidase [Polyangiaceae bacterium LLY-WYZ-15_(1-7)]HJL36712.1 penicillin-insensitive murein endopeptidase [Polyangiaceae bacterium LLY-WYZ-15_(1-7)]
MRAAVPAATLACALALALPAARAQPDAAGEPAPSETADAGAADAPGPPDGHGPSTPERTRSRSVGRTNHGWILRSAQLESDDHVRVRHPGHAHGVQELVDLLAWAAGEVARAHPGSVMHVGDLSKRRGGRLRPHRSHRAGRDADIGFYLKGNDGEPLMPRRFIEMNHAGKGTDRSGTVYHFDDARNWAFVAALVGQDVVPVQYVMCVQPLKERLMAEGRRQGAPEWLLARVEQVVGPRHTGRGRRRRYGTHDSHFHIRIYCPRDDRPRCRDSAPFWDWVDRSTLEPERRRRTRRRRVRRRRGRGSARRGSDARRRGSAARRRSRRRGSRGSSMRR